MPCAWTQGEVKGFYNRRIFCWQDGKDQKRVSEKTLQHSGIKCDNCQNENGCDECKEELEAQMKLEEIIETLTSQDGKKKKRY